MIRTFKLFLSLLALGSFSMGYSSWSLRNLEEKTRQDSIEQGNARVAADAAARSALMSGYSLSDFDSRNPHASSNAQRAQAARTTAYVSTYNALQPHNPINTSSPLRANPILRTGNSNYDNFQRYQNPTFPGPQMPYHVSGYLAQPSNAISGTPFTGNLASISSVPRSGGNRLPAIPSSSGHSSRSAHSNDSDEESNNNGSDEERSDDDSSLSKEELEKKEQDNIRRAQELETAIREGAAYLWSRIPSFKSNSSSSQSWGDYIKSFNPWRSAPSVTAQSRNSTQPNPVAAPSAASTPIVATAPSAASAAPRSTDIKQKDELTRHFSYSASDSRNNLRRNNAAAVFWLDNATSAHETSTSSEQKTKKDNSSNNSSSAASGNPNKTETEHASEAAINGDSQNSSCNSAKPITSTAAQQHPESNQTTASYSAPQASDNYSISSEQKTKNEAPEKITGWAIDHETGNVRIIKDNKVQAFTREDLMVNTQLQSNLDPALIRALNLPGTEFFSDPTGKKVWVPKQLTKEEILKDPKLIDAIHRIDPKRASVLELPEPAANPKPSEPYTIKTTEKQSNNTPDVKTKAEAPAKPAKQPASYDNQLDLAFPKIRPLHPDILPSQITHEAVHGPDHSRPKKGVITWTPDSQNNQQNDPSQSIPERLVDRQYWDPKVGWRTVHVMDPSIGANPIYKMPIGSEYDFGAYDSSGKWIELHPIPGTHYYASKEGVKKERAKQKRIAKENRDKQKAEDKRVAKEKKIAQKAEEQRLAEENRLKQKAKDEQLAEAQRVKQKAKDERRAEKNRLKQKAKDEKLAEANRLKQKAEEKRLAKENELKKKAEDKRIERQNRDKQKAEAKRVAAENQLRQKAQDERLKEAIKPQVVHPKPWAPADDRTQQTQSNPIAPATPPQLSTPPYVAPPKVEPAHEPEPQPAKEEPIPVEARQPEPQPIEEPKSEPAPAAPPAQANSKPTTPAVLTLRKAPDQELVDRLLEAHKKNADERAKSAKANDDKESNENSAGRIASSHMQVDIQPMATKQGNPSSHAIAQPMITESPATEHNHSSMPNPHDKYKHEGTSNNTAWPLPQAVTAPNVSTLNSQESSYRPEQSFNNHTDSNSANSFSADSRADRPTDTGTAKNSVSQKLSKIRNYLPSFSKEQFLKQAFIATASYLPLQSYVNSAASSVFNKGAALALKHPKVAAATAGALVVGSLYKGYQSLKTLSTQPLTSSNAISANHHYSAPQRETAKERDEAQKRTNAIKQTLAEFRNNFQNDLHLSGLFKEASERVAYNPNNSYTKACADAIEAVCTVSSELNSKGLAQQASALRNLAEAINFASEVTVRPANVHAAAPSNLRSELPVNEVQLALEKAFSGLQYASSATKEAFVKAYQDFKAQPTEDKIRDLAMVSVAIMLSEATVSTVLVRAVAQHVAYLITAEVAATGALAVATGIRNNPVAPITTTWQAIAEDVSAVHASAPSTVSTMVSSGQNALQTVAATFQPPAVMQSSVMAGHTAALQAAQANAIVGAVGNAADLKTVSEQINQTSLATLKNGYYEVNGFKFSERYYNKLWTQGRKAPSLVAKTILEDPCVKMLLDPKPGFFRYEVQGWEMVYNPITKEVWHLQPI